MKEVWQIVLALAFPLVCLALVLWLSLLEDTLTRNAHRSGRKPDPAPILRLPARDGVPAVQASDVSRSAAAASVGGSTNR